MLLLSILFLLPTVHASTCDETLEVFYEGICRSCSDMVLINHMRCDIYEAVVDTYPPEELVSGGIVNTVCVPYDCTLPDNMLHCTVPTDRHDGTHTLDTNGNILNFAVTAFDPVNVVPHINWLSDQLHYNKADYKYDGGNELVSAWVSIVTQMDWPYVELNSHDHCVWLMDRHGDLPEQLLDEHCTVMTPFGDDIIYNFYAALTICYTNMTEADCEGTNYQVNGEDMTWQRLAFREPYRWNRVWYGDTAGSLSTCHRNWMEVTMLVQNGTANTDVSANVVLAENNIAESTEHLVLHDNGGNHTVAPQYQVQLDNENFDLTVEREVDGAWVLQTMSSTQHYLQLSKFYRILIDTKYRFNYTVRNEQMHGMPNLREAIQQQYDEVVFVYQWTYDERYDGTFSIGPRYTWNTYQQESYDVVDFSIVTSLHPNLDYWSEDSVRLETSITWSHSADPGRRLNSRVSHDSYQPRWGLGNPLSMYGYTGLPEGMEDKIDASQIVLTKNQGAIKLGWEELTIFGLSFFGLSVVAFCTVHRYVGRKNYPVKLLSGISSNMDVNSLHELQTPLLYNRIAEGVVVKGSDIL